MTQSTPFFHVKLLEPGMSYKAVVFAENKRGRSNASNVLEIILKPAEMHISKCLYIGSL